MAQQRWELENEIRQAHGEDVDALYRFDADEQKLVQQQKPWSKDPHFYKQ